MVYVEVFDNFFDFLLILIHIRILIRIFHLSWCILFLIWQIQIRIQIWRSVDNSRIIQIAQSLTLEFLQFGILFFKLVHCLLYFLYLIIEINWVVFYVFLYVYVLEKIILFVFYHQRCFGSFENKIRFFIFFWNWNWIVSLLLFHYFKNWIKFWLRWKSIRRHHSRNIFIIK